MAESNNLTASDSKQIFFDLVFRYTPSVDVAISNTALFSFASLMILAAILGSPHRPRYVWIIFVCAVLEAVGYGARVHTCQNADLSSFIVQALLILVVPIALALVNYIVVGLLLEASGKQVACLPPRRIARAFFVSDIACFLLQSGGAGMLVQASSQEMGKTLIVAGILLQLGFFTAFCLLTSYTAFSRRLRLYDIPHFKPVFQSLLTTSVLIYVRNIFRACEYLDAQGYIGTHEWVFDVFESFAILMCFVAFSVWHFGRLLPYTEAELAAVISTRGASQPPPWASDKADDALPPVPDIIFTTKAVPTACCSLPVVRSNDVISDLPPSLP